MSQSESQPNLHIKQPATNKHRQYGGLGAISNGSQLLPNVHNLWQSNSITLQTPCLLLRIWVLVLKLAIASSALGIPDFEKKKQKQKPSHLFDDEVLLRIANPKLGLGHRPIAYFSDFLDVGVLVMPGASEQGQEPHHCYWKGPRPLPWVIRLVCMPTCYDSNLTSA